MNDLWYITYSDKGECNPDGFFCPTCFDSMNRDSKEPYSAIDPRDSPHYTCNSCNKDYRD